MKENLRGLASMEAYSVYEFNELSYIVDDSDVSCVVYFRYLDDADENIFESD